MLRTEPGSRIDHYVVDELIARTETSSILKATDQRDGRQLALKVPHVEAAGDPLFHQRFLREQEICEALDHPSVARALARGNSYQRYIALELAPGKMLRCVLSHQSQLSVQRVVAIGAAICEALQYIHTRGVVHRDLKPENIMIAEDDRIKLVDFGIASRTGARRLTFGKLSQVMGSPDYIAPEQVQGKRGDARIDIYAVGVMLYEMLTGHTPFAGANPFVVMNSRLVSDPVSPREIDPALSPELDAIVLRALARKPEHRYARAQDLAHDLLHPESVRARAASAPNNSTGSLVRAWLRFAELWR